MAAPVAEGYADFDGHRTWYKAIGHLGASRSRTGRASLVVLHGGPGATHDYLLSLTDLAEDDRAVVFYDQIGNGNYTHLRGRGSAFSTVGLFVRQLANLVNHPGIDRRYKIQRQSWGGMLAQEHALALPPGPCSVVLSNTTAS